MFGADGYALPAELAVRRDVYAGYQESALRIGLELDDVFRAVRNAVGATRADPLRVRKLEAQPARGVIRRVVRPRESKSGLSADRKRTVPGGGIGRMISRAGFVELTHLDRVGRGFKRVPIEIDDRLRNVPLLQ